MAGPLVTLLTGFRFDPVSGGLDFVDQFAFKKDPAAFRRAWLAWRGLDDDPAAQPPPDPAAQP